jgi:predicted enzyme related to lactoylglutathione lyase
MIRGIHGLFYSSDPEATRAFFKDLMKLPGSDVGEGWWIFDLPEGDLGVHPVDEGGEAGGCHLSFYCDDLAGTIRELKARGAKVGEIADRGWGLVTELEAPGGVTVMVYQPRYQKKRGRPAPKRAPAKKPARVAPKKKTAAKKSAAAKKRR